MLQSDANLCRIWRDQPQDVPSIALGASLTTHPVEHA